MKDYDTDFRYEITVVAAFEFLISDIVQPFFYFSMNFPCKIIQLSRQSMSKG